MKSRKGFALIISLVLAIGIVLPGTLALSTDQAATNGELTVTEETPTPTPEVTETPTPTPEVTETPTPTEEPKPTETPVPSETEKPAETEAPKECTCSAAEGEAHKEGCPLYAAPEKPADPSHIDICSDDCTDADCKCTCHLMKKIMACKTLEEIEAIIKATPEDVLKSLSEEQVAQVEAYMDKLMPAPLPAIVIEESEPPVESEIYRPTVNYTNVAPFGDPVTGGNN